MRSRILCVAKYPMVFITCFLLLVLLMISAACIPAERIKPKMLESAEYMCESSTSYLITNWIHASEIDHYADCIMLSIAHQLDEKKPLESVMWASYYGNAADRMNQLLLESVQEDLPATKEYLRYWHGSAGSVRFLHLFWNVKTIYVFHAVLMILLGLIQSTFSAIFPLDWNRAIEDYYKTYPKQTIRNVDDLPCLTMDQIRQMLADESEYNICVKQFQERVSRKQFDHELSKLTGISPGSKSPLFRWLFHGVDTGSSYNVRYQIGMEQLNDLFCDQYLSDFPIAERVMMQPHRPYYYRGERKFYGESKPTFFRVNDGELGDMLMVKLLKIEEAALFLDSIPSIRNWNLDARVNYMALCQHYGLDTLMIDVTSDLMTALFFACCKWAGNKWEPLTDEDIEREGDAVIHIASKEIFDIEMAQGVSEKMIVIPIGHQPLLRCSKQQGYMGLSIEQGGIIDLYTDKHFTTDRFLREIEIRDQDS